MNDASVDLRRRKERLDFTLDESDDPALVSSASSAVLNDLPGITSICTFLRAFRLMYGAGAQWLAYH